MTLEDGASARENVVDCDTCPRQPFSGHPTPTSSVLGFCQWWNFMIAPSSAHLGACDSRIPCRMLRSTDTRTGRPLAAPLNPHAWISDPVSSEYPRSLVSSQRAVPSSVTTCMPFVKVHRILRIKGFSLWTRMHHLKQQTFNLTVRCSRV